MQIRPRKNPYANMERVSKKDALNSLEAARDELIRIQGQKNSLSGSGQTISKELLDSEKAASRVFNRALDAHKYANKRLGASIKGAIVSLAEKVGIDTSAWHSASIHGGDVAKAFQTAEKGKGAFFSRLASKPFRVIARNPVTALVTGGLLTVVGVSSAMHRREERRSEEDAMAQAAQLQDQMMAQQMLAQQPVAPTYQITQAEYEAMQSRMRGGNGPQGGHADSVMAARQAAMSGPIAPAV